MESPWMSIYKGGAQTHPFYILVDDNIISIFIKLLIQVRFQPCDVNGYGYVEIVQPVWGTIKSTYQLKPNGILVHNNGDPVFMWFTNN